jgi:hypothetical protein
MDFVVMRSSASLSIELDIRCATRRRRSMPGSTAVAHTAPNANTKNTTQA